MDILTAMLLAFLPKRYRAHFTPFDVPPRGALVGGILEALFTLGLLFRGYYSYMNERLAAIPTAVLEKAGEKGGESAIMGLGPIVMLEYLIHVSTILFLFFFLEGCVRAIAAVGGYETLPSLPLKAIERLDQYFGAQSREHSMGARIPDVVQPDPSGSSLQISSCRPKPWTQLTTISHDGQLYELVSERQSSAPRPFVYVLRKKPPTAVIRGIYPYDPNEPLQG